MSLLKELYVCFVGGFYKYLAPNGAMQESFRGGLLPALISGTRSGRR